MAAPRIDELPGVISFISRALSRDKLVWFKFNFSDLAYSEYFHFGLLKPK